MKPNLKTLWIIFVVSLVASYFVICVVPLATSTIAVAQQIVLKFADHNIATGVAQAHAIIPTLKKIEERSGGRLKIESYWGGSLVTAATAYESLRSGLIDIGKPGEYAKGAFLVMTIGAMPFAARDPRNIPVALNTLIKRGYMDESLKGLKFLTIGCTSPYGFLFKDKKPMKMEDFKGIKVRSPGAYLGSGINALGMTPVTVTPTEVYDAISKGVVEGGYWSRSSHVDYKIHELCKYFLAIDAQIWSSSLFAMNENSWKKLPPELQKIIEEEMGDKLGKMQVEAYLKGDQEAEKVMKAKGIEIYTLSPLEIERIRKAMLSVWEVGISDLNKKGLDGKKIMAEFVIELRKLGENPPWSP